MKKSKVKRRCTIIFLLMFLLLSVSASAQVPILISGIVVDADYPKVLVAGSVVTSGNTAYLNIGMVASNTNSIGYFIGNAISSGTHKIKVTVGANESNTNLQLYGSLCCVVIKWDKNNNSVVDVIPGCK